MIIALFANMKKKESFEIARSVRDFLKERNVQLVTRDEEATDLELPPLSSVKPDKVQFSISMGGDGTIIRLVHHYPELQAPILGVNLGHLGFMADIPLSDLFPSLDDLLSGEYTIERRLMMEGITPQNENCFAINEMAIHRSQNPSLIDLSIHVDGRYLNTFSADGVIIATPNGSTAYSLAAGGPILTPDLAALVITPISPHTISNRPIVLMPEEKIEIQYLSPYAPVEIAFDGISRYQMETNDLFTIFPSRRTFDMVALNRRDTFTTFRTKLGWSGQLPYADLTLTS